MGDEGEDEGEGEGELESKDEVKGSWRAMTTVKGS